jgi:hypothetical protein
LDEGKEHSKQSKAKGNRTGKIGPEITGQPTLEEHKRIVRRTKVVKEKRARNSVSDLERTP